MVTAEDIRQLPTDEKLRIMELIWQDLSSRSESVESPAWHEEMLQETIRRVDAGAEAPIDWAKAKESLRAER